MLHPQLFDKKSKGKQSQQANIDKEQDKGKDQGEVKKKEQQKETKDNHKEGFQIQKKKKKD